MNIFSKLFGKKGMVSHKPSEHAVIVHIQYGKTDLQSLNMLEEKLVTAINLAGVGEYDGNEVAVDGSDAILYMYGPDGDQLFAVVRPILESSDFARNAVAKIRYGSPNSNSKEVEIKITSL